MLLLAATAWRVLLLERFGGDVAATRVLIVGAMGGLAIGAFACRRLAMSRVIRRWTHTPGALIGALQAATAVSLLVALLAGLLPGGVAGSFPYVQRDGVYEPTWPARLINVAVVFICAGLPCIWAGAALGWWCDLAGATRRASATTLMAAAGGALIGWLAGRFMLLPAVGGAATLLTAAVGLALLGVLAVLRGRGAVMTKEPGGESRRAPAGRDADQSRGPDASAPAERENVPGSGRPIEETSSALRHGVEPCERSAEPRHWIEERRGDDAVSKSSGEGDVRRPLSIYIGALAASLLVGGFIADAAVRLRFVGADLVTSGALIVAWVLLAIALACAAARAVPGDTIIAKAAAGLAVGWHLLLLSRFDGLVAEMNMASTFALGAAANGAAGDVAPAVVPFGAAWGVLVFLIGLVVFPPVLLLGLWLPWSTLQLPVAGREPGRALGVWLGGVAAGWLIVSATPALLGVTVTLRLMLVVGAVGVALLLVVSPRRRLPVWAPVLAMATLAAGVYLLHGATDDRLLPRPAPFELGEAQMTARTESAHVATMISDDRSRRLFIDRTLVADVSPSALQSARLLAHIGLLAQEAPRRTLIVGFGAGVTAAAAATEYDTNRRIDVVETRRDVIDLAAQFGRWTGNVQDSDRLRFIDAAAPAYLRAVDEPYDLIALSARSPVHADGAPLVAAPFYELVEARLLATGVVTQAIPFADLPSPVTRRIIATFARAFPHALTFIASESQIVLVGSRASIDLKRMETELARRRHTRAFGHDRPIKLMARLVLTRDAMLDQTAGDASIDALAHGLTYGSPPSVIHPPFRPASADVAQFAREAQLACADELADVLHHLGRLRYHVPDFPSVLLPPLANKDNPQLAGSRADWLTIGRLSAQADALLRQRKHKPATLVLHDALEPFAEQPALLLRLADADAWLGQTAAARGLLERFIGLEPREATGYLLLARVLVHERKLAEARAILTRAISEAAPDPRFHVLLGDVLAALNQPTAALREYERAMAMDADRITGAHRKHFDLSQQSRGEGF